MNVFCRIFNDQDKSLPVFMMNLFFATLLVSTLSLTSQNPLCFKPWELALGSEGAGLIADLQSWPSTLQNPSVPHHVVPNILQGLRGCAQPSIHPQDTRAFCPLTLIYRGNRGQSRFQKNTEKSTEWKRSLACHSQDISVTWIWKTA